MQARRLGSQAEFRHARQNFIGGRYPSQYLSTLKLYQITFHSQTLMDGQISLDSQVGAGSTFTIILPLRYKQEQSP